MSTEDVVVSIRMPRQLRVALKHIATDEERTLSELLRDCGEKKARAYKRGLFFDPDAPDVAHGSTDDAQPR